MSFCNNFKLYYKNGDLKYEGELKNGKLNGYGTQYFKDGQIYVGEFKNNKKHGFGIEYYINDDKYDGEWRNNSFNGKGIYYCNIDNSYVNMKTNIKIWCIRQSRRLKVSFGKRKKRSLSPNLQLISPF